MKTPIKKDKRKDKTQNGARSLGDIVPNPDNPRFISQDQINGLAQSLKKFGDLSGIVVNVRSGLLVGAHQRLKVLPHDAAIVRTRVFDKPTAAGTVALGYVEVEGETFPFREVDWPKNIERAAMIAANKHGGDWDESGLKQLLREMDDADRILAGFSGSELEDLLTEVAPPKDFDSFDENIAVQHRCPKCGYKWSGKPS